VIRLALPWLGMVTLTLSALQLAAAATPKSATKPAAPRTLEEIAIEGQVDLPEVLFISSRERIKTNEFHHRRYLKSAAQIAEAADFPRRLTTEKEN
jgi:hypothetical protein